MAPRPARRAAARPSGSQRRGTTADAVRRVVAGLAVVIMVAATAMKWMSLLNAALMAISALLITASMTLQEAYSVRAVPSVAASHVA